MLDPCKYVLTPSTNPARWPVCQRGSELLGRGGATWWDSRGTPCVHRAKGEGPCHLGGRRHPHTHHIPAPENDSTVWLSALKSAFDGRSLVQSGQTWRILQMQGVSSCWRDTKEMLYKDRTCEWIWLGVSEDLNHNVLFSFSCYF